MMKKIFVALMLAVGVMTVGIAGPSPVMTTTVMAASVLNPSACEGLSPEQREAAGCENTGAEIESKIPGVVSVVLWIAGILAVGMIIYAGVRMIISQGDPGKVAQERQTIVYAAAGLIVVLLAYAIVGFVVGEFGGGGEKSPKDDTAIEGEV